PESAVGGPLGVVRNGDKIRLSVKERRVDVLVSDEDLARRRQQLPSPKPAPSRGYARLYAQSVLGAEFGCDFVFLRPSAGLSLLWLRTVRWVRNGKCDLLSELE